MHDVYFIHEGVASKKIFPATTPLYPLFLLFFLYIFIYIYILYTLSPTLFREFWYFFLKKKVRGQKICRLIFNIYFQAREGIKTRGDTPIWNWTDKRLHENVQQVLVCWLSCMIYIWLIYQSKCLILYFNKKKIFLWDY